MSHIRTQLFPPAPAFTEAQLPPQIGKVFIVTGGNTGIGYGLCKMLYDQGATVYMASRTRSKAEAAIASIHAAHATPRTPGGAVHFLALDLSDLRTIAASAATFSSRETKLDVLWNNAGAGIVRGERAHLTAQGHNLQLGTNCFGHFLFTQLLLPKLQAATRTSPPNSVRIAWTCSVAVESAPKGGVTSAALRKDAADQQHYYALSKAGGWLLASEFARRYGKATEDGIVSVALNPGQLRTALWDTQPFLVRKVFGLLNHPPIMGSYTELWAGLAPEVTVEDGGRYVFPFGRWDPSPRQDMLDAFRSKEEGGTGQALDFWELCVENTKQFA